MKIRLSSIRQIRFGLKMDIESIVTFKPRLFYEVASYKICSD